MRLNAVQQQVGDWSDDPDVMEVLSLLKLAKAPSRYARRWRLPTLAFQTFYPLYLPGIDLEPKTGLSEINKETRRVERNLTNYIKGLRKGFGYFTALHNQETNIETLITVELKHCKLLSEAIIAFESRKKLRLQKPPLVWHFHANSVFIEYKYVFGRGNSTKDSPANEFVRLALARSGFGIQSPHAVQSALDRFESPSKKGPQYLKGDLNRRQRL